MPDFWTVLWTAVITLGGAWFAYWLTGKPRLIVFSPQSTFFKLDPPDGDGQILTVQAGQVVVQNNERDKSSVRCRAERCSLGI